MPTTATTCWMKAPSGQMVLIGSEAEEARAREAGCVPCDERGRLTSDAEYIAHLRRAIEYATHHRFPELRWPHQPYTGSVVRAGEDAWRELAFATSRRLAKVDAAITAVEADAIEAASIAAHEAAARGEAPLPETALDDAPPGTRFWVGPNGSIFHGDLRAAFEHQMRDAGARRSDSHGRLLTHDVHELEREHWAREIRTAASARGYRSLTKTVHVEDLTGTSQPQLVGVIAGEPLAWERLCKTGTLTELREIAGLLGPMVRPWGGSAR